MQETAPPPDLPHYHCPACGDLVAASDPAQRLLQCPRCGEQFFVNPDNDVESPGPSEGEEEDAQAAEELQKKRDAELSELHIRQVSNLRRGAYRSRSWLIIGAAACLVGAAQLVYISVVDYRHGLRLGPIGDVMFAIIALMVCGYFARRIVVLTREIRASHLPDPQTPPDFSALRDGSQRWKDLDDLSKGA